MTQDFALNRWENEAVIFLYGKDIYFALIIDLAELGIESRACCMLGSAPPHLSTCLTSSFFKMHALNFVPVKVGMGWCGQNKAVTGSQPGWEKRSSERNLKDETNTKDSNSLTDSRLGSRLDWHYPGRTFVVNHLMVSVPVFSLLKF